MTTNRSSSHPIYAAYTAPQSPFSPIPPSGSAAAPTQALTATIDRVETPFLDPSQPETIHLFQNAIASILRGEESQDACYSNIELQSILLGDEWQPRLAQIGLAAIRTFAPLINNQMISSQVGRVVDPSTMQPVFSSQFQRNFSPFPAQAARPNNPSPSSSHSYQAALQGHFPTPQWPPSMQGLLLPFLTPYPSFPIL